MTAPSPLTSTTFADGELTNEVKWYTRVFQVINWLLGVTADTGWLNDTSIFTPVASGVTITSAQYRRSGATVSIYVGLTTPAVAASASGDVANATWFTINDARFVPSVSDQPLSSSAGGQWTGFYVRSDGAVIVFATVPNSAIASGSSMGVGGTYLA